MSHRSHRGRSAVAAVVLLLLVSAPVAAFAASRLAVRATALAAPGATITPHTGLLDFSGDGQFVTVKWSGFAKGSAAYLRECTRGATDITSQCSQGATYGVCGFSCPGVAFLGTTAKDGTGQGLGQVAIGIINAAQNLDPIPGRSFTCDYQNDCSLYVMQDPFDLTTAIAIPISFATPADACPEGGAFTTGSGGSGAFRMFLGWSTQICNPPQNIGLQYTLRPAQSALDDYVAGFSDYAVGPMAMDHTQQVALAAAGRTVAYAPVSLSALVFAYRIYDQVTGSRVNDLVLSPDVIAKIFTGRIVQWNDPEIQRLNPTVHFPTFIAAVTRGDANEESYTMTRWLWANARATWLEGGANRGITPNPLSVGPTNLIPSFGQVYLITGPTAEAQNVALGGTDFGSTSTYGLIGYVDSSWAGQYDLPTVKIRFDDGTTVAATPATITAALAHMTDCGSGLLSPDVTIQDSHVWPMPTVSYMAVPHDAAHSDTPPTAEMAGTLASVIRYGVGPGQQDVAAGYVPLPNSLKTQARAVADTIMKGPKEPDAAPCPKPPPSSPPPTTPPPTTPPPTTPPPTTPPPTTPPPTTPPPTPSPVAVVVAAQPPPMTLASARASAILPAMVLFGLLSVLVSPVLLFGDRVGSRLAPAVGRVRRLSPMTLIRRTRSKRGGP